MRSPSKPQTETVPYRHLEILNSLGFGPDTVLMNDPKLFVDRRFLASILVELHDKLGQQKASLALFEIGLLHGTHKTMERILSRRFSRDRRARGLRRRATKLTAQLAIKIRYQPASNNRTCVHCPFVKADRKAARWTSAQPCLT